LGSDGSLLLNLASSDEHDELRTVLLAATKEHRTVFVGVVLDAPERRKVMRRLDNAGAETAALLSGRDAASKRRSPGVRRQRAEGKAPRAASTRKARP
jgi:hypothetical protein